MADTILVFEFVSAGGMPGHPDEATLQPIGVAMRDAVVADLLRLPADRIGRVSVADSASAPASSAGRCIPCAPGTDSPHSTFWPNRPHSTTVSG